MCNKMMPPNQIVKLDKTNLKQCTYKIQNEGNYNFVKLSRRSVGGKHLSAQVQILLLTCFSFCVLIRDYKVLIISLMLKSMRVGPDVSKHFIPRCQLHGLSPIIVGHLASSMLIGSLGLGTLFYPEEFIRYQLLNMHLNIFKYLNGMKTQWHLGKLSIVTPTTFPIMLNQISSNSSGETIRYTY